MYELRQDNSYPLLQLLKIAKVAKSTYYDNIHAMKREDKDKWLKAKILSIYNENKGIYGYRRITIAMNADKEVTAKYGKVNHKRVKRLMNILELKSKVRVRKYKSYKGEVGKIAPNILNRDFSTTGINQKYVSDITEFKVAGSKIYLSPLIDLHTSEVLGYSYSSTPNVDFVIEMLEKSLSEERYDNLIIHTDQGFHYQNIKYINHLSSKGILQSMSRKGNCYDNAMAENFFSHLKSEFYNINDFKTVKEFTLKLEEYIEYYNNKRIVSKLKMSPIQYREHCLLFI